MLVIICLASAYPPAYVVTGHPAYPGLHLFKMLLNGIWHGGLSNEAVEDMANANLYVMRFSLGYITPAQKVTELKNVA